MSDFSVSQLQVFIPLAHSQRYGVDKKCVEDVLLWQAVRDMISRQMSPILEGCMFRSACFAASRSWTSRTQAECLQRAYIMLRVSRITHMFNAGRERYERCIAKCLARCALHSATKVTNTGGAWRVQNIYDALRRSSACGCRRGSSHEMGHGYRDTDTSLHLGSLRVALIPDLHCITTDTDVKVSMPGTCPDSAWQELVSSRNPDQGGLNLTPQTRAPSLLFFALHCS
jgi:hypothetical protein